MSEMLTPLSDSRHTKAEGKFTPQICRSRIFVPANECTWVVPMYPSQSAMSHLHSLAQSMYIATFLPKHVIPTCFADYVTSTSGATRLAFDLSPWPQVLTTCRETRARKEVSPSNRASILWRVEVGLQSILANMAVSVRLLLFGCLSACAKRTTSSELDTN